MPVRSCHTHTRIASSSTRVSVIVRERVPVLPGMFDDGLQPRRHKRVRQTARAQYHLRRGQDIADAEAGRETQIGACLRLLARFQNQFEHGATSQELFAFAVTVGERRWHDVACLRPRLTSLFKLGLIQPTEPRPCRVTGATVRPWRVREIGSQEAR
jgi:hypothetical protein